MYYTSEVLPKARYTHRELESYFWDEVGRGEFISYGSWLRHAVETGIVVKHGEPYTFDNFFDNLTLVVRRESDVLTSETVYEGPIPTGKVEWERPWGRNPDPEYGEDGRLYYVGDGKWELVIWTAEPWEPIEK